MRLVVEDPATDHVEVTTVEVEAGEALLHAEVQEDGEDQEVAVKEVTAEVVSERRHKFLNLTLN